MYYIKEVDISVRDTNQLTMYVPVQTNMLTQNKAVSRRGVV